MVLDTKWQDFPYNKENSYPFIIQKVIPLRHHY
jgi:hypothetical protein